MLKHVAQKSAGKNPFRKIQAKYGLKKPKQIQLKILWFHVKALMKAQYPDQLRTIEQYDHDWRLCEIEIEETKKGALH